MLDAIARLRRFNRVVTREIGALDTSYLGRGRPLSTARVLHLIKPQGTDVADIRQALGFDSGLMSRLLRSLEDEGLIRVIPDAADRRRRIAQLTDAGQTEWHIYDDLGHAKAAQVFDKAGSRQQALIDAMDLIATVMLRDEVAFRDADPDDPAALSCIASYYQQLLDTFPGDFRAGMLPLPLPDAAKYRPPQGAFLIAWSDDLPVGCVSLRPLEPGIGEVKRLWVNPIARGQGLGRRLMRAIEDRARSMGLARLQLDTNATLTEAVALYRSDGWTDIPPYTTPPANLWLTKRL
jgi:GNAT superfamily N-acetyltransferase